MDESIAPEQRRERLTALIEPSAERTEQLAKDLFDQIDPTCGDSSAWSALFNSVLSAPPKQPLQRRAHLYVAEFVRRHCDAAWSFITESTANGALGMILPSLLVELRRQDSPRCGQHPK